MMRVCLLGVFLWMSTVASASQERRVINGAIPFEKVQVRQSEIYFKKIKVAFFDADSTLRVSKSGSVSANHVEDVELLPCVAPRIAELRQAGYLIAIVSNQGGVGAGVIDDAVARGGLQTLLRKMGESHEQAQVHYFDYASHKNKFRKEQTGMAHLLAQKLRTQLHEDDPHYGGVIIDKKSSFMVGDSLYKASDKKPNGKMGNQFSRSDRCFAENYHIRYFDPAHFFGWLDFQNPISVFVPQTGMEQWAASPQEARQGGAAEAHFCRQLVGYKAYSSAIRNKESTATWIADYQIKENGEILPPPLFHKKGCKSEQ